MAIATGEMILTDLVDKALNGLARKGAGFLRVSLLDEAESVEFLCGSDVEFDLRVAERHQDTEMISLFRQMLHQIDTNDWNENVLICLCDDHGIRLFCVEPKGAQDRLRTICSEFTGD